MQSLRDSSGLLFISFGVTSAYLLSEVVVGERAAGGADFFYQLAASGGRKLDLFSGGDEV